MRTWHDHRGWSHVVIDTDEEAAEFRRLVEGLEQLPSGFEYPVPWLIREALRVYDEAEDRAKEAIARWRQNDLRP